MDPFLELFGTLPRAGPGDDHSTETALRMMRDLPARPRVLDLGCGPGVQSLALLRCSNATVVAVDVLPHMVTRARDAARAANLGDRLEVIEGDMGTLELDAEGFDVIWSEGAIYVLGFEAGLARALRWLRPGGYMAVSEAVWLRPDPSPAARALWEEYPEIDTVENKLAVISSLGLEGLGHFLLPRAAWTVPYYAPLKQRLEELAPGWRGRAEAEAVADAARRELDVFEHHGHEYGYAFFVMRRPLVPAEPALPRHALTILAVDDLSACTGFYRAALGWSVAVETPVYVEFTLPGGQRVGLYERTAFGKNTGRIPAALPEGELTSTELYLYVPDLPLAIARMERAGARLLSERAVRGWGDEAAYFADPAGNVLVLATTRAAPRS